LNSFSNQTKSFLVPGLGDPNPVSPKIDRPLCLSPKNIDDINKVSDRKDLRTIVKLTVQNTYALFEVPLSVPSLTVKALEEPTGQKETQKH
jgi:hypothetical protein